MNIKSKSRAAILACLMLAVAWGNAGAADIPVVTGEQ